MQKNMAGRAPPFQNMRKHSITIRRLSFPFPPNLDPVIVEGRPEESFLYIGLSLLLPFLEPYLIHTMREAKRQIDEPKLKADIDAFNGQESQHYKQHIQFNKALCLTKYQALKMLESEVESDYRRYTETKSLRFNLAYAEGFEAYTTAMARFMFQIGALERVHPVARAFFQWHIVEELEHRTVAFDVYEYVCGSYFYRLAIGCFAQWHLSQFVLRVVRLMMHTDREAFRANYGGFWRSFMRVHSLLWLCTWHLLPKVIGTYMPWYTPHRIAMPDNAQAIANSYSEMARSTMKNPEVKS